jgi:hypothetical protein
MSRRLAKFVLGAAAAVFVVGIWTAFTPIQAASGGCICPLIYAPVKCSNGKTYPNLCRAQCQHAKDCVPTGEI